MPETKLQVGDDAPDFELHSDAGERVKLSDQRGKRVILFFYPKDDTPGCTRQACGLRDNYAAIQEANAVVFGVSPDDVSSHQAFKQKFSLPYPLLIDEGHARCRRLRRVGRRPQRPQSLRDRRATAS